MVNKSGKKGTEAETACLKYVLSRGFPGATRKPKSGSKDIGDLWLMPSPDPKVIVEVKADQGLDYPQFLRETEKERVNAGAAVGVCFIKPPGVAEKRMHLWWCLMHAGTYDALQYLADPKNFMVAWMDASEAPLTKTDYGRMSRRFQPGNLLAEQARMLSAMGTTLRPGAKRTSRSVGDMRFMYLPDALELLRWAGFGEAMVTAGAHGHRPHSGPAADQIIIDEPVNWGIK